MESERLRVGGERVGVGRGGGARVGALRKGRASLEGRRRTRRRGPAFRARAPSAGACRRRPRRALPSRARLRRSVATDPARTRKRRLGRPRRRGASPAGPARSRPAGETGILRTPAGRTKMRTTPTRSVSVTLGPLQWSANGWWSDISPASSAMASPSSPPRPSTCWPRRSIEPGAPGAVAWSSWPRACDPRTTRMQPCASDAAESATQQLTAPSAGVRPKYLGGAGRTRVSGGARRRPAREARRPVLVPGEDLRRGRRGRGRLQRHRAVPEEEVFAAERVARRARDRRVARERVDRR